MDKAPPWSQGVGKGKRNDAQQAVCFVKLGNGQGNGRQHVAACDQTGGNQDRGGLDQPPGQRLVMALGFLFDDFTRRTAARLQNPWKSQQIREARRCLVRQQRMGIGGDNGDDFLANRLKSAIAGNATGHFRQPADDDGPGWSSRSNSTRWSLSTITSIESNGKLFFSRSRASPDSRASPP